MNTDELQAKVRSLEKELQEARELLAQSTHDAEAFTRELCRTRAFAFSAETLSADEVIDGCISSLDRYGFCVIDNLIPPDEVGAVCEEVKAANVIIDRNINAIREVINSTGREEAEFKRRPQRGGRSGGKACSSREPSAEASQRHRLDASVCATSREPLGYGSGAPRFGRSPAHRATPYSHG